MAYYTAELYEFFDQLSVNNNREWFAANRPRYERLREHWLADIDRLIAAMTPWEPDLVGQTAKGSVYRIYRDTRFSTDKTPYKTHFAAAISPWGRNAMRAGYYLDIGITRYLEQGLYGGLWDPDAALLKKMRHAIVDNIEEWEQIVNAPDLQRYFPGWCSSTLKTIPKGWDRNHPQAHYLRMTNYGKAYPVAPTFYLNPDWPLRAADIFHTLKPLIDFINYTIDE